MATFSHLFTATIYGNAGAFDGKNGGWQLPGQYLSPSYQAFSQSGIRLYTISPVITFTNAVGVAVTLNSIIEVLPSGILGTQPVRLTTDSTFAQLYTAGL